ATKRRHSAVHLSALQHPSLLETAAALRPVTGSPGLRLLRRLRPVPNRSVDDGLGPDHPCWRHGDGQTRDGSRVRCDSLDEGGVRLCPSGLATSTPQTFPAASTTSAS